MATISTTIELVDRISGRLTAIGRRVSVLTDCFLVLGEAVNSVQAGMAGFEPGFPAIGFSGKLTEPGTQKWSGTPNPEAMLRLIPVVEPLPELPAFSAALALRTQTGEQMVPGAKAAFAAPATAESPIAPAPAAAFAAPATAAVSKGAAARSFQGEPRIVFDNAHMPEMFLKGQSMMEAMGAGMRSGAVLLTESLQEACAAVESTTMLMLNAEKGRDCGLQYTDGLVLGITDGRAGAYSAAYAVGAHAGTGMVNGIYSKLGAVRRAAAALANAAESAMRSTLDVHSPSRVTEEIGLYFGEGFANGIAASASAVQGAVGRLTEASYGAFADDLAFGGDVLSLSEEDVRRLRQLAEREVVNRFTTAELKIDFTANNNINSNMDLDGVVSYLEEQLTERLEMAAEGVYS